MEASVTTVPSKCQDCRHWDQHKDNPTFGFCRAELPKLFAFAKPEGDIRFYTTWPQTAITDCCGKIETKG